MRWKMLIAACSILAVPPLASMAIAAHSQADSPHHRGDRAAACKPAQDKTEHRAEASRSRAGAEGKHSRVEREREEHDHDDD